MTFRELVIYWRERMKTELDFVCRIQAQIINCNLVKGPSVDPKQLNPFRYGEVSEAAAQEQQAVRATMKASLPRVTQQCPQSLILELAGHSSKSGPA